MNRDRPSSHLSNRRGVVYVLALLLLAVCTALAGALAVSANVNLKIADNETNILNARMSAEGGLSYVCYLLANEPISTGSDEEILNSIADLLRPSLEGPGKLPDGGISCNGRTVTVPPVSFSGANGTFSVTVVMMPDSTVGLKVTGLSGSAKRSAGIRMAAEVDSGGGPLFGHGIITNGTIQLAGNSKIRGANNAFEAQVYSASTEDQVFTLSGNSTIEGDVFATNSYATATLTGNSKIAGCKWNSANLDDHVHTGVEPFEIPEVDSSPFEPLAINPVTQTSGNYSLSNIRIPAGTNPHFSGNYTLRGVIYIEAPNNVTFSGNTTIEGVIVAEDAGEDAYTANRIKFTGNTTLRGADSLPDLPEYAGLKELPGSMLLAPGFGVDFYGNFGTVIGVMAAEQFSFHGNCGGTIHGSILNYGQTPMIMQGNSNFYFDQSDAAESPSGFAGGHGQPVLVIVPMSYAES